MMAIPKKHKQNKKVRGIYSSEILLSAQQVETKLQEN